MGFDKITKAAAFYSLAFELVLLIAVGVTIFRFAALHARVASDQQMAKTMLLNRDRFRDMINEETGVRAYVATGDARFLDIYTISRKNLAASDGLAKTYPAAQITASVALSQSLQSYFEEQISLVAHGHRALAIARLANGKAMFDRLRLSDAKVERHARTELFKSLGETSRLAYEAIAISVVMVALILGAIAASVFFILRLRVVQRHSLSDPLTNLPNRRQALSTVQQWLREPKSSVGLIYLDLDGFKKINDKHGHAMGDGILRIVAERLRENLWGHDVVARVGGDEFLCVIGPDATATALERVSHRLHHVLTRPYYLKDQQFVLGCSFGFSLSTETMRDPEQLIASADHAMYRAKHGGGGIRSAASGAAVPVSL